MDHDPNNSADRSGEKRRGILRMLLMGMFLIAVSFAVVGFLMQTVDPNGPGNAIEQKVSENSSPQKVVSTQQPIEEAVRGDVLPGVSSVAPKTPWLTLDEAETLMRIGVGSCLDQRKPQPIWDGVLGLAQRPQLFLMIGDNVYGDIKSPAAKELVQAYRDQAERSELADVRQAMPFLATWDDHDYGGNDAGVEFVQKANAAKLFYDFWQLKAERPADEGIYYSRIFGPSGRRVQIIMLDTRSYRSKLQNKSASFKYWGRYGPSKDRNQTMLGEAQWSWLEEKLRERADVRLVVSSVQLLSEGHGFERWGNLPLERQRFFELVNETGARGVVLLSGDRHFGAFYSGKLANGQVLPEMTASSLNRPYGPSQDGHTPERVSQMYNQENFGLVDIDWQRRRIELMLKGVSGETIDGITVRFTDLKIDD